MSRSRIWWIPVAVLLVPPWVTFLVACYWRFVDDAPPVMLMYQHPKFLSREARNVQEAKMYEISAVDSGDFVWTYREVCVRKSAYGTARGRWTSGSFEWNTPERPIMATKTGCSSYSSNLRAPTSNPSRHFSYSVDWIFSNNPLVDSEVQLPPIEIDVHSTQNERPTADRK